MSIEKKEYEAAELVKDLADKIGIHRLYAIARELRGEGPESKGRTAQELEEVKAHLRCMSLQNERMRGEIATLAFAVRCNGVSGNEVRYE